jgi:predicted nicotinamide N-methyase
VQVVTLPEIGDVSIVCKTKRDISIETPLDKRDDESLGWGYWDRIWPSSMAFSEYLIHQFSPAKLTGTKVLEIGCGTGVPGVVAAQLGAFTMFSDMVPVTLEAVRETCRLNHIRNFDACTLDWSEKNQSKERYDMVLGCEVFYDEAILADISRVLEQVLAPGGKGLFCDPNRLGLDTIELGFQEKFKLSVKKIPLNWPPQKSAGLEKMVYLYEITRKGESVS